MIGNELGESKHGSAEQQKSTIHQSSTLMWHLLCRTAALCACTKTHRGTKVQQSPVCFCEWPVAVCFWGVLLVCQWCSYCQTACRYYALTRRGREGSCGCVSGSGFLPTELLNAERHLSWHLPLLFYIGNPLLGRAHKTPVQTFFWRPKCLSSFWENDNAQYFQFLRPYHLWTKEVRL